MRQGFGEFLGVLESDHPYFGEDPENPVLRGYAPEPQPGYLTDAFAREAVSFIHRHAAEPFFLYFAPNAVHGTYQATPAQLAAVPASVTGSERRVFAAVLMGLDRALGSIAAALRAEAVDDETIVAVLSDNGGVRAGRTAPLRGRKHSNYEGGIRVPFLLSWPGRLAKGTFYRSAVSSLDLLPTFLAAARAPADRSLDGVDLLPWLAGRAGEPHSYLFWGDKRKGAVRHGNWKWLTTGELFDLAADVSESHNVIGAHPEIAADLRRARARWLPTLAPPQS
jgi:arylsulfatase A-like enzyme